MNINVSSANVVRRKQPSWRAHRDCGCTDMSSPRPIEPGLSSLQWQRTPKVSLDIFPGRYVTAPRGAARDFFC
jgi:hypothetical protein